MDEHDDEQERLRLPTGIHSFEALGKGVDSGSRLEAATSWGRGHCGVAA